MKISYAITTKNEGGYIHDLLTLLHPIAEDAGDEIVVLDDFSTDDFTLSILHGYEESGAIRVYQRALNGDFAAQKNYLNSLCEGDFIFQIDADETLHPNLMKYIHDIVDNNPEIDLYHIPRVNVVNGLTQADIDRWGWKVNELGWVQFPDYQGRLYRNHPDIRWEGKVHERIVGHKTHAPLPAEEMWALYHIKDIDRQRKQNDFYNTL
jgi:glycosyltransferase involved in cell wall biosynthesis